jgi:hypothetical protein
MNTPKKYIIKCFDKTFYCKVSNYNEDYIISVGGKKGYCYIVSIKKHSSTEAYIDRVEYNENCVKDGYLEEKGGMYKLICGGLYFIKENFPKIQKFTLMDDSHVLCKKGSKEFKLNLAYDYIIKYNETWYQKNFKATLPTSILNLFDESLNNLEKPLPDFTYMVSLIPEIKDFKIIYDESKSPRVFIQNIRNTYKDEYCFKVWKWLHHFLNNLGIKIYKDLWFINTENIIKPENYSVNNTNDTIRGGSKKKFTMKKKNFSEDITSSIMGVYE